MDSVSPVNIADKAVCASSKEIFLKDARSPASATSWVDISAASCRENPMDVAISPKYPAISRAVDLAMPYVVSVVLLKLCTVLDASPNATSTLLIASSISEAILTDAAPAATIGTVTPIESLVPIDVSESDTCLICFRIVSNLISLSFWSSFFALSVAFSAARISLRRDSNAAWFFSVTPSASISANRFLSSSTFWMLSWTALVPISWARAHFDVSQLSDRLVFNNLSSPWVLLSDLSMPASCFDISVSLMPNRTS